MTNHVIINCVVTGSIHVSSVSPYLPITPTQIAQEANAAVRLGQGQSIFMPEIPRQGSLRWILVSFRNSANR